MWLFLLSPKVICTAHYKEILLAINLASSQVYFNCGRGLIFLEELIYDLQGFLDSEPLFWKLWSILEVPLIKVTDAFITSQLNSCSTLHIVLPVLGDPDSMEDSEM